MRPSTPPASLARLKAVSMPSFIWRPSSFAAPENGAAMPKRISRSVPPRTLLTLLTLLSVGVDGGCWIGAVGAVAAAADDWATRPDKDGPADDRPRPDR